jgi:hypothetical protein
MKRVKEPPAKKTNRGVSSWARTSATLPWSVLTVATLARLPSDTACSLPRVNSGGEEARAKRRTWARGVGTGVDG